MIYFLYIISMKGVSKIVEEVLLIAIVILLILALFFMFGNWFSKNQNQEIHGIVIGDCVFDKNAKSIKIRMRNALDKQIDNVRIELYNNDNMEKISSVLVSKFKPNEVRTIVFPVNDTSKVNNNIRIEFSGVYIPGKEVSCKVIG